MSFTSTNNLYGFPQPLTRVFPAPIIAQVAPTTSNYQYPLMQQWLDEASGQAYILVDVADNSATWEPFAGPLSLDSLTGDTGGAITPVDSNITLAGTADQITTTGTTGTITFSLIGPYTPATYTAHGVLVGAGTSSIAALSVGATGTLLAGSTGANPAFTGSPSVSGSLTAATTITATLGAITATNGNLVLGTAGNKLSITTGSNASLGVTGNMSGTPGSITVNSTAVTASSIILFSRAATGGTPGNVSISAQSSGSFTLLSTGNETSTFNYLIIN